MATNVGALTVEMAASTAKLQQDFGKAVKIAETASKAIEGAFKGAVGALAAGVSVGAFVNLVKSSIDAQDHLNDLSKATGVAFETLGGLGFAAQQNGTDLD